MKKGGKELDRDDKFDSDYIWPEGEILFYSLYLLASKMKVQVPLSGRDVRPYCREQRKQGI